MKFKMPSSYKTFKSTASQSSLNNAECKPFHEWFHTFGIYKYNINTPGTAGISWQTLGSEYYCTAPVLPASVQSMKRAIEMACFKSAHYIKLNRNSYEVNTKYNDLNK